MATNRLTSGVAVTTFSYSSVTQYMECGKRWQLSRKSRVPETPAWWLILGSTVHRSTELFDTGEDIDSMAIMEILDFEIEVAKEKEPNLAAWQRTYYDRAKSPEEMYYATFDKAQEFHEKWVSWRDNDQYEILGVELAINLAFPYDAVQFEHEKDITFIGYVDRLVLDRETGKLGVVDIKTGKSTPPTDMQLGWYRVGISNEKDEDGHYYAVPSWGAYWKADTGELTDIVDLSRWSSDIVQTYGQKFTEAIDNEIYLPNLGSGCARCPVQRACYAYSGPTEWSKRYDPIDPRYDKEVRWGDRN